MFNEINVQGARALATHKYIDREGLLNRDTKIKKILQEKPLLAPRDEPQKKLHSKKQKINVINGKS
jgi:hypothetical protein